MNDQAPARPAVARASLMAGPLVLLLYAFASFIIAVPATTSITGPDLAILFLALLVATAVGFGPALIAGLIASGVLQWLAERTRLARSPELWALTGAVLPIPFLLFAKADPAVCFAFCGAGALCALVARHPLASSLGR